MLRTNLLTHRPPPLARGKQRELDDQKRALDLTVETRVQESLGEIREKAKRDAEEGLTLKVAERDEAIASLRRQIEVLKQKAEQGSQQLQGEVQELELESILATKFPADLMEPVPKGEFGGDILHEVLSPSGQQCGSLLWESKRTKNWSDSWLGKLRNDQRTAKADLAVLVSRILLVFRKFTDLGTVRQTLMWFLEHGLEVPTRTPSGKTQWKRPVYRSMHRLLTSPVYGGAYAYGKTEHLTGYEGVRAHHICRRKPRDQWLALIPGTHEGYVSWDEFEHIQRMIQQNNRGEPQPGAVRNGQALLAGLLRCRRCGRKLSVRYTGNGHDVLRYSCMRGFLDNGEPRCIAFGGITVDEAIGREVLRVVQPAAIEASMLAHEERVRQQDDVLEALERDRQAATYAADRARRQYDASDPENRLVTAELERRWNLALQHVHEIEARIQQHSAVIDQTPTATREDLSQLATQLEAIWADPITSVQLKKRIVRTLIEEVLVDVDSSQGELLLTIHWKGGAHTPLRLPRRRRGQCSTQTPRELIEAVSILARISSDDIIASVLNRNGHLTGRGNRWTRERVTALRSHHRIPCYKPDDQQRWVNLTDAAAYLEISPRTLRLAIDRGQIPADHPFADGPWVISREILESKAAKTLKSQAHSRPHQAAVLLSETHLNLFSST
jgi:hypothetical protein